MPDCKLLQRITDIDSAEASRNAVSSLLASKGDEVNGIVSGAYNPSVAVATVSFGPDIRRGVADPPPRVQVKLPDADRKHVHIVTRRPAAGKPAATISCCKASAGSTSAACNCGSTSVLPRASAAAACRALLRGPGFQVRSMGWGQR